MTKNQAELIGQGVQEFMDAVHEATAESLKASVEAIEAMSSASVVMQRMATQQVLLQALLRQRNSLIALGREADDGMAALLDSQVQTFDLQIVETLEGVGVPREAAETALLSYDPPPKVVGKTTRHRTA